MNRPRSRRHAAYTLVEMLIVVLVLAILMAVAMPLYLSSVTDSQIKTCSANMQSIANAEAAYRTHVSTHDFAEGDSATVQVALADYLGAMPLCPSNGAYSVAIARGGETSHGQPVPVGAIIVSCSLHGTYAPGVDAP